jgi:hypothetical protein
MPTTYAAPAPLAAAAAANGKKHFLDCLYLDLVATPPLDHLVLDVMNSILSKIPSFNAVANSTTS